MNIGHGKLQCSDDGVVAGVCRGLADYLSLDVGVLRFTFVAMAFVSFGVFAIAYVVLWLILPAGNRTRREVDVRSESPSEKPSQTQALQRQRKPRSQAVNEPPVPPPAPGMEEVGDFRGSSGFVVVGVTVGIVLVVVLFCIMLSMLFPVLSPAKLWPLGIIAPGIARMVLPGRQGYRMEAFCDGVVLILVGNMLLLNTSGMIDTNLRAWIEQGWPLLSIALGCVVLWKATGLDGFSLFALAMLALFCMIGALFCSVYGPASYLIGATSAGGGFVGFGVW